MSDNYKQKIVMMSIYIFVLERFFGTDWIYIFIVVSLVKIFITAIVERIHCRRKYKSNYYNAIIFFWQI